MFALCSPRSSVYACSFAAVVEEVECEDADANDDMKPLTSKEAMSPLHRHTSSSSEWDTLEICPDDNDDDEANKQLWPPPASKRAAPGGGLGAGGAGCGGDVRRGAPWRSSCRTAAVAAAAVAQQKLGPLGCLGADQALLPIPARFAGRGSGGGDAGGGPPFRPQAQAAAPLAPRLSATALARLEIVAAAGAYMASSVGLITFNKFMVSADRFPYAIFLAVTQMSCSCMLSLLLRCLRPTWYPSQTDPGRKVNVDRNLVVRVLLPIAACFAVQLILSNMAFMHSSVAFLQMTKEANVVLVYTFSCCFSLETPSWRRALVLLFIVAATALTIRGEVHLSCSGLAFQILSMVCESLKTTFMSYSLAANGRKLDALTYNLLVAPLVLLCLCASALTLGAFWPDRPVALALPPWEVFWEFRWLLLLNGALAFTVNACGACFVSKTSPITFMLSSIVMKDFLVVLVGASALHEALSGAQFAGFAVQLMGAAAWALLRPKGAAGDRAAACRPAAPSLGLLTTTPRGISLQLPRRCGGGGQPQWGREVRVARSVSLPWASARPPPAAAAAVRQAAAQKATAEAEEAQALALALDEGKLQTQASPISPGLASNGSTQVPSDEEDAAQPQHRPRDLDGFN